MKRCKHCGRLYYHICLDCHYRHGGAFNESDQDHSRQLGEVFSRRSGTMFRAAFTADQLQQVSPAER